MVQNLKLNLKQIQKLKLTPELNLSLEILSTSSIDLKNFLEDLALENPLMDISDLPEDKLSSFENSETKSQDLPGGYPYADYTFTHEDKDSVLNYLHKEENPINDLFLQLKVISPSKKTLEIGEYMLYNLDNRGFLPMDDEEIAQDFNGSLKEINGVRKLIGSLDPPGIGSRDFKAYLILQNREGPIIQKIIESNLEDIGANRLGKIAKERDLSIEEVKASLEYIRSLKPYPLDLYQTNQPHSYVLPEASISIDKQNLVLNINNDFIPQVGINSYYQGLLKGADKETSKYIRDKINAVKWVIDSINQRQASIELVLEGLMACQKDFLLSKRSSPSPLSQKDLAKKIGLSESTVSRVVRGKYISTPRGTLAIQDLFSRTLASKDQNIISVDEIKIKIENIIDNEDKKKPLSDSKIESLLKNQGIVIARRTVAKYREELGIDKSSVRKVY